MTIDTNTFLIVALAGVSLFSLFGYARAVMRERSAAINNRINELETDMWREHEKMYARLNRCEDRCKMEKCDKSYYNTGA